MLRSDRGSLRGSASGESQKGANWDSYFLSIVSAVGQKSSCSRRQVGAVLTLDRRIIATGYNGTPFGMPNCNDGGCPRCASDAPSGDFLSAPCYCNHAEDNIIAMCARFGIRAEGSILYLSLNPCHDCIRLLVQVGVEEVRFKTDGYPVSEAHWPIRLVNLKED